MKCIFDDVLITFLIACNFLMVGVMESSLFAILPNLFGNKSELNVTRYNETCVVNAKDNPPYVIISVIFLMKHLTMNIVNPIVGILIGVMSDNSMILCGQSVGITALVVYSMGHTVPYFIIGRILDAFSGSAVFVASFALISRLYKKLNTRSRFIGLANFVFFFSLSFGPTFGIKVAKFINLSAMFMLLIPGWILCIILTSIFVRKDKFIETKVVRPMDTEISLIKLNEEENLENKIVKVNLINNDNTKINQPNGCRKLFTVLKDPFVICCILDIIIIDLGQFSLTPTLPTWMQYNLCSTETEMGLIWIFAFFGYGIGVLIIILVGLINQRCKLYIVCSTKFVVAGLLIWLPFIREWKWLSLPILGVFICTGIGEQVIFPLCNHLADTRHQSDYGSMNSLISQSLTICGVIATLASGPIAEAVSFKFMCILLGSLTLIIAPISLVHLKHIKN